MSTGTVVACGYVIIDGFDLPNVNGIRTEYTAIASARRTIGGLLRVDTLAGVGTKRAWRVSLNKLPRYQRMQVRDFVLANTGIRSISIDTVGSITGTVRITSDPQEGVRVQSVGPIHWSDGTPKLWADGTPVVGADVTTGVSGWFIDHGGGSLELRLEEA